MATIYFISFVVVCALVVLWATRKSKSQIKLERKRRIEKFNKARAEKLSTPSDNLLAHKNELWQTRRQRSTTGVNKTNQFVPKSASYGEPEYDGYSRRDRHHVRQRTAQVKKEGHIEDDVAVNRPVYESEKHATRH